MKLINLSHLINTMLLNPTKQSKNQTPFYQSCARALIIGDSQQVTGEGTR